MTDEKKSKQPDELGLEPEKIADLDVADEDADEVRGGCCGAAGTLSLVQKPSIAQA